MFSLRKLNSMIHSIRITLYQYGYTFIALSCGQYLFQHKTMLGDYIWVDITDNKISLQNDLGVGRNDYCVTLECNSVEELTRAIEDAF